MKILHTADLHAREKDLPEIEKCLQAIVLTAQEEKPDLAVIAGDVFDSRDVRVDSGSAIAAIGFVSALADVCPVAIVLGTPSHDGAAPKILSYVRGEFPVIVADRPMQAILYRGWFKGIGSTIAIDPLNPGFGKHADAILTLIPQPTKQYFQTQSDIATSDQEIGQAMSGLFMGFGATASEYQCPHILVYHGAISGAKVSTGQTLTGQDIEVSIDQFDMSGADLHLCGHIHMQQQLGPRTFYSGSPYRINWGEAEDKGFWMHTQMNVGGWDHRFVETPARKTARFAFDMTGGGSVDDYLLSLPEEKPIVGACVRLDITAWQDEAGEIARDEITGFLLRYGALSVDLRIIRVPRENVRAEAVLKADTLRDKLRRMAELRGEEVPESVLAKADELETATADEVVGRRAA